MKMIRYLTSASLTGDIRRLSSNPLMAANLFLPSPGENGSLSHNEDIVINAADQVRNALSRARHVTKSPRKFSIISAFDGGEMSHMFAPERAIQ